MSNLPKNNRLSFRWRIVLTALLAITFLMPSASNAFTVVIDPGHGGHDVGCVGVTKVKEKDVALSISLKLGKLIEERMPDVKVVFTRKTDVFLELHERAEIANAAKADLFICVHCNSACRYDKPTRKEICNPVSLGTETYVMGLHKTEANLEVAKRENNVILLEKDYTTHYEGFDPNSSEANIIFSLYQNTFMEKSLSMASLVQEQLTSRGRTSRGVKPAGFWVLYKTAMPSILIETGFLTNPEEEYFLASSEGQHIIAKGIYKAFKAYSKGFGVASASLPDPVPDPEPQPPVMKQPEKPALPGTTQDSSVTAVPAAASDYTGVWFSVQLLTSDRPIAPESPRFNGVRDIRAESSGTVYKYCYGKTTSFQEAVEFQGRMRSQGFKDAFVVAYRDKDRISVQEARQSQSHDNPK